MNSSHDSSDRLPRLILPSRGAPLRIIGTRLLIVLGLIAFVVLTFWLDRENLRDASDNYISFVDIVYFTMVTITTVGYGDIVPIGDRARLLDAFLVTPIRLFIWALFLGTTYQIVLQRQVEQWRARRHGARMKDHIVVIGFGYKGQMVVREMMERGHAAASITVVDEKLERLLEAQQLGCVGLHGDATKDKVMRLARVETAQAILICLSRDDASALCILTVRNIGSTARMIACARDRENIRLLEQAGSDEVVVPAKLAGYLMANAIDTPLGLRFIVDLLASRGNVKMVERLATHAELGMRARDLPGYLVVGLQRADKFIGFWDSPNETIQSGDYVFAICGVAENGDTTGMKS